MKRTVRGGKRINIVISILIAVFLWFYVVNGANPDGTTTLSNVPVVILGEETLEAQGLMVTDLSRDSVNLKVKGKRKSFLAVYRSDVKVQVDVSSLQDVGRHSLKGKIIPESVGNNTSLDIKEKENLEITVTVKEQTEKEIPVKFDASVTMADGYEMGEIQLTPSTIKVKGPEEVIEEISSALVLLEEENIKESIYRGETFVLLEVEGNEIKDDNLTFEREKIFVSFPVVKVYELPLEVELVEGGGLKKENVSYMIIPRAIKLSGDESVLQNLSEISLGSIDLASIVSSTTLVMKIPLPEGVRNHSGIQEAKVNLSIDAIPTRPITTDRIQVINVPDGYEPVLETDSLDVLLRGAQENIDAVEEGSVRAVVDLSDVEATGNLETLKARIIIDGHPDVGVVDNHYDVTLTLKRA